MKKKFKIISNDEDMKSSKLRLKHLSVGCMAFISTMLFSSSVVQATDLQIYAAPTAGQKTIIMMIDTSGSMNFIKADYEVCGDSTSATGTNVTNRTTFSDGSTYKQTFSTYPYERRYCYVSKSSARNVPEKVKDPDKGCEKVDTDGKIYRCYDRLTRLKDGVFAFLNSNNPIVKNVYVGLGQFPIGSGTEVGKIIVPAQKMGEITSDHRALLKDKIAELTAIGGTPTAAAYAEAAAYLLGTNTVFSGNILKDFYKEDTRLEDVHDYYTCNNSSYPHLRNEKYCYKEGFSGSKIDSTTGDYHCDFNNNYNNYVGLASGSNRNRCYKAGISTGNDFIAASNRYCNKGSNPHLNISDNKCYSLDYGNDSRNATSVTKRENVTKFYECKAHEETDYYNSVQICKGREGISTTNWVEKSSRPSDLSTYTVENYNDSITIYKKNELQNTSNTFSGFSESDDTTKEPINKKNYQSPLPIAAKRQSCDGQGVYMLSDGEPTAKTASTLESAMKAALKASSFSCSESGALGSSNNWNCMSVFAKKLFNGGVIQTDLTKSTNTQNVPIQTAFVGFSRSFSDPKNNADVLNACKLSSRAQADRSSDDTCSPNKEAALATPENGYGNGGFFAANTSQDVTNSVIQFINNLGVAPLDPLSTGAISVPVDALNPNGFQSFGYLRALEPNPAQPIMTWIGNLKKYSIIDGALKDGSTTIFNDKGAFNTGTKDIWNTGSSDNGAVRLGGVYSRLQMPTIVKTQFRNLFTDLKSNSDKTEVEKLNSHNTSLLSIPVNPTPTVSLTAETLISQFKDQETLKLLSPNQKIKLLNYLGYDLDLTTNDVLPDTLTPPQDPFISMGGSIHSFPVQLTYSGDLDVNGDLTTVRQQSVLYGSMEGGLHIVDSKTGEEQMVFVPAEILLDAEKSRALRAGEGGEIQYGVSGAWVADPTYKSVRGSKDVASTVSAKTMKVYGGMRMGGYSYYGLDVIKPTNPKMLFRIDPQVSGFSRLGQTWSKPVLVNVRHGGTIKRAMIVGGGYDMCYENPRFKLGAANPDEFKLKDAAGNIVDNCQKDLAKGNAIYIVDADNGTLLWSASNAGASTNNPNMKHSIVSRISTLDRDGDGLVDHLYFGDLGGQVFRADINNKAVSTSDFGVRVVRLANLGESLKNDDSGDLNTGDNGDSYRFYQPPTVTIHDVGTKTFIAVGIASGDRSTPLDVTPTTQGRERLLPSIALTGRPINKVFGIFDFDFVKRNLITNTGLALDSKNLTLASLQGNPQLLTSGQVETTFLSSGVIRKYGWYRSLSSLADGTELVGVAKGGVTRVAGGVKAFEEEPIAIKNNLFIPVYDPQGTGIAQGDPCKPRIVGESNRQQYCLPFGVCLNADGTTNAGQENKTGFQLDDTDKNTNILGAGIQGITLGPKDTSNTPAKNSCGSLTLLGNITGSGQWDCQRILNPTRWYEKYVTAK